MVVPQGSFDLDRPDAGGRSPLRAWDAADELALRHLDSVDATGTTVLVGDAWGALACALATSGPTVVLDSYLAGRAVAANLGRNGLDAGLVTVVDPDAHLPATVDVAVIKVPKTIALLEHQLHQLAPSLHDGSVVLGAGMTRHVHTSTIELFERIVGPTTTSRAEKKARLLHATVAASGAGGARAASSPWPQEVVVTPPGDAPITLVAHAGVFSAHRLDPGTALLLAHLPEAGAHHQAVDLGCGTGVVGTVLARRDPDLHVTFVDDSPLAVASARATWARAHADRDATFVVGDALLDPSPIEADLIVVNPPFHRDHTVGDATAWQMFSEAQRVLPPGGELLAVGNRHLAHHAKLTRLFGKGRVSVVASDPGFVVVRATA